MGKITIPVSVLPLFRQSQRDEIHRKNRYRVDFNDIMTNYKID